MATQPCSHFGSQGEGALSRQTCCRGALPWMVPALLHGRLASWRTASRRAVVGAEDTERGFSHELVQTVDEEKKRSSP